MTNDACPTVPFSPPVDPKDKGGSSKDKTGGSSKEKTGGSSKEKTGGSSKDGRVRKPINDKSYAKSLSGNSSGERRILESDDDDILVRRLKHGNSSGGSSGKEKSAGSSEKSGGSSGKEKNSDSSDYVPTEAYPWPIALPTGVCTPLKMQSSLNLSC